MTKKYAIEIVNDKSHDITREPSDDDTWDRGDYHTYHNIEGFRVHGPDHYFDLVTPYQPRFGTLYYLLYVIYSTGDSFGHTTDGGIEYIGIYKKDQVQIAVKNKAIIEAPPSERKKRDLELYSPEGKKFKTYAPWEGYFESLSRIDIIGVHRLP